jgi:type IV fimbrial biogenesis protein FimT
VLATVITTGTFMSQRPKRQLAARHVVGFTLIELMVTIAVAAVLATLAAPSFRQFILSQRIKNASYDLISALTLTRSEAITRNANVNLVMNSSWTGGWCVTTLTTCDATQLFTHEAFNSGITITASGSPSTITYGKDGRTTTAVTTFTIASTASLTGVSARYVSICLSGVPRSSTSSSGTC